MNYMLVAVNAKYIHSNLGVYSLKAYGEKKLAGTKACIRIGEYTVNHSRERVLADIYRNHPDVAGFSCYIWNMEFIRQLLYDLPKILPDMKIWLGGPEVSYDAPNILQEFPQVCGIMMGEGEETFARLAMHYEQQKEDLSGIAGIAYQRQGEIRVNPPRPLLDLNQIPFPYRSLSGMEHRIIYYESSRGCPFSCSYCLSSIDRAVRFRDLELVKTELQFFLDGKARQVKFVDRTFNCKKSHAMAIWQYILEHDNQVTNFHFEIAADLLDEDEVRLLHRMRPGLIQLEIGVQTTNARTIREIRRRMDLGRVKEMVEAVRKGRNIHQHLDLIAGLPYEDLESFCTSFDQVYALKPDQLQLGFLKVLKGSYMEEKKEAYGLAAGGIPPYEVLSTRWLGYPDILKLKQVEEMVEVYYNSGQFGQAIHKLEARFERPIELFESLAKWYGSRGLFEAGHSRQARYAYFLEWAALYVQEGQEREEFLDALITDFYLRENAKSRPAFARDLKAFGEGIRRFYQKEDKERRYLAGYDGYDSKQLAKMTHIEVLSDKRALLFDYRNRDPLTYNASLFEVELP